MFEYMENIPTNEAQNLKKAIQDLFRQTFVMQMKIDPVTMQQRNNPRYDALNKHREFIEDYLSVLDCELIYDSVERVYRIVGEGVPTMKLSLNATKLLVILKKIYYDKIMGEGLNAPVTNLAEIREYGASTNLLRDRMNDQELNRILVQFRIHQIIEVPEAIVNLEDYTPIYIYNTINMLCSAVTIGELVEKYRNESVDIQDELMAAGEEDGDEAGEEDI